jgi:hypothetical protein
MPIRSRQRPQQNRKLLVLNNLINIPAGKMIFPAGMVIFPPGTAMFPAIVMFRLLPSGRQPSKTGLFPVGTGAMPARSVAVRPSEI